MTVKLGMKCEECSEINYTTTKNNRTQTEKLSLKKYCSRCRSHKVHKEVKLKS